MIFVPREFCVNSKMRDTSREKSAEREKITAEHYEGESIEGLRDSNISFTSKFRIISRLNLYRSDAKSRISGSLKMFD